MFGILAENRRTFSTTKFYTVFNKGLSLAKITSKSYFLGTMLVICSTGLMLSENINNAMV
jgi:hypothetical protein